MSTSVRDLIKEVLQQDEFSGFYADKDTLDNRVNAFIADIKDEQKVFPEDYERLFNAIFPHFSNDDLKKHLEIDNDRLNNILKSLPISTVGQATIAGLDYNTLGELTKDDYIPDKLKLIREKIHLHERFMDFRGGESKNQYLSKRGKELKRLEREIASRYTQIIKKLRADGIQSSDIRTLANNLLNAEYDIEIKKLDRKYPTNFSGHELYGAYREQNI